MKTPRRIIIIGAGPAGLSLSRCLKARGIQSTIYEKSVGPRRYGYSIVLSRYQPLLKALRLDLNTLYAQAAVQPSKHLAEGSPFRVRRAGFEAVLREGCDVRYEHEVTRILPSSCDDDDDVNIQFGNGSKTVSADLVIAADGTHSAVRSALLADFKLQVLPHVAFNGKRNVDAGAFASMRPAFESAELLTLSVRVGETLLQAYVNEFTDDGGASISYTYSRPSTGLDDPCHRPDRSKASATDIPEEFFVEVGALMQRAELRETAVWKSLFDVEKMKRDRLLHWLMRSGLPSQQDVETAVDKGVVLLGDALLTSPIIGSRGANVAVTQAVELAEAIEKGAVKQWLTRRFEDWRDVAKTDLSRL